MTVPTQAQIEAFDMAYLHTLYPDRHDFVASQGLQREAIIAGLTAAAEVGEQNQEKRIALNAVLEQIEAATIERCAQVVKKWFEAGGIENSEAANAIISRLRALKDKP